MKKKIIGIIPTFNLHDIDNDPYQDRASFVTMYIEKIKACGGIPIGILDKDVKEYADICDAYLWPGGVKIRHEFYYLLDDAIKNHKKVLGICLGMQSINTYFNIIEDSKNLENLNYTEIYKHYKISNPYLKRLEDDSFHRKLVTKNIDTINNAKHKIDIKKNSILYDIYKSDQIDVVSLHSSVVNRTTKDIKISAMCGDVVEGVEYKDFILGVQFHPEILLDNKIFEWLVK